jgi:hypothetical protein
MIKRIIFSLVLLPILASAQQANDWIDYSQSYFKFPIVNDGVYQITYQQLFNAGVNITNIDPRSIQVFAKGDEQPIYIEGESDGTFDGNDFIELYCEHNDGWYDHKLYSDSAHVLNPHYSMFNDTAFYFLTWNNSTVNRRMTSEVDLNFNAYKASPYFWNEVKRIGTKTFNNGQITSSGWAVPEYSDGEGWFETQVFSQNSSTKTLDTPFKKAGAPDGWIKTELAGRGSYTHFVEVSYNDSLIYKDNFFNKETVTIEVPLKSDWVDDVSELFYNSVTPVNNVKDRFGIAYSHIRYPREYNLGGENSFLMHIPSGTQAKDLLVMSNYDDLNSTVRLYDITGGGRVTVQPLAGSYYALVPNNGIERKCFITSESAIRSVDKLVPVNGGSTQFVNYEDLIIQNGGIDYLLVSAPKLMDAANDYGVYRESRGLKTIVANMDQLYDQYSYGIRKHPLSIKNFVRTMIDDWGYTPEHLFLCGKSIAMNYSDARRGSSYDDNLVPTWSILGADAGLTQGILPGSILDPSLSTGRIAATTEEQLRDYLAKVQEYESAPSEDWMKKVLHFGGGSFTHEQDTFKRYLKTFETKISGSFFGGDVHTFLKDSSDPLQLNVTDSVTKLINGGVSLMTFFGHAYGNNFDQSIDEPENYLNDGKYPFILANSCLIGNIHKSSVNSGSERFVLSKGKGAIGFLASSSLGVPSYLFQYSDLFYQKMGKDYYGSPVGKVVQQIVKTMQDSSNTLNRDVCLHMTLHCDPAVVLNSHPKPDYSVYGIQGLTQPNVYITPKVVTSETDSFTVNIIVTNIGRANGDSMSLNVTRKFPSQTISDTTYSILLSKVYYSDTVRIKMSVDKLNGVGLNNFSIFLDALSEVDEMDEMNNLVDVDLFIKSSDLVPVYPYEYAVVPSHTTPLKASTGTPYVASNNYYFQIDTTDKFDSPSFYEEVVTSKGGVLTLDPAASGGLNSFYNNFSSNTTIVSPQVFFWRVSVDSTGQGGFNWKESSFQHVTGKSGWGQAHFEQLKKDDFLFLDYNEPTKDLSFVKQTKSLNCVTHQKANYNISVGIKYDINGAIQCFHSMNWAHMFFVAVIDKKTLIPWHPQEHGDYGHINFSSGKVNQDISAKNFYFNMDSSYAVDSLVSFVNDVPDSNYVVFYNYRSHFCQKWLAPTQPVSVGFETMLDGVGANVDSLKNYPNNWPYILFFQKGKPSNTIESFSDVGDEYISLQAEMKNNWVNGYLNSTTVGPTNNWGSLHWQLENKEIGNTGDTAFINVFGIDTNGKEILIIDSLATTGDLLGLNDSLNASTYPYLRLQTFFADDNLRTPSDLIRWQVLYEEAPEAAINPLRVTGFTLIDTVEQGEEFLFITAIENISNSDMDSMQVSYRIIDNQFNNHPFSYVIKKPLLAGDVLYDTVKISTSSLIDLNNLWYEINPYVGPKAWQLEQYHFNNLFLHQFYVSGDEKNPLLDVTFDGVHLLNGDIVNPSPYVVISLDDENQFLALDDASLIKLYINYPTAHGLDSLVLLDPSNYVFKPASMPDNKCVIEFQGDFINDGVYELRIQAQDKSSNVSGSGDESYDYRISFEIINESSITQLINYPNPFSTSTRFVFTLTGSEIPENMLIQIMTISGRVVREITKEELGPIHIGKNISEFSWDGTDAFGDKLANGVYLYRVIVQSEDEDFKERNVTLSTSEGTTTLSNKYFKNGIGKMYILR